MAAAPGGRRQNCASVKPKEGFPRLQLGGTYPVPGETGRTEIAKTQPKVWRVKGLGGSPKGRLEVMLVSAAKSGSKHRCLPPILFTFLVLAAWESKRWHPHLSFPPVAVKTHGTLSSA